MCQSNKSVITLSVVSALFLCRDLSFCLGLFALNAFMGCATSKSQIVVTHGWSPTISPATQKVRLNPLHNGRPSIEPCTDAPDDGACLPNRQKVSSPLVVITPPTRTNSALSILRTGTIEQERQLYYQKRQNAQENLDETRKEGEGNKTGRRKRGQSASASAKVNPLAKKIGNNMTAYDLKLFGADYDAKSLRPINGAPGDNVRERE